MSPVKCRQITDETCAQVIRGNSVVMLEALERIGGDDRRGGGDRG